MKNIKPKKDREFLIGGNALTLTTKGGNVELFKTEDHKKPEKIAYKKN